MNPETRNLVAAISLSMAVLIGYQLFFVDINVSTASSTLFIKGCPARLKDVFNNIGTLVSL